LDTIIEDLYEIENILTTHDTLVIIIDEEPNETIRNRVKYLFENQGIFVVIHNIKRLQFNILDHSLTPDNIEIIKEDELEALKETLNIKKITDMPEISRFDPLALAIMLRPGQVMKCMRNSITALKTPYYRICV
jgi:DNA-directed RNA polymerase subunit H (RpoH/RPB5)